ncbi:helix-turn-helix domain-containing protein [Rhodomicrobium lacus]|uniref:helix-turn-helix domain-containing protein n=1 Tax=Rhodomicrobium lacus TaxID=2498452 RepID=UPI000F8E5360|nr:helix-turn-helix domain-containing protein [Rhodomicrobium lacus]
MITGDQLRAARALARLTIQELAELATVNKATVVRIESGARANRLTLIRLQEVLEEHGITFIDADDTGGSGVRYRLGVERQTSGAADNTSSSEDGSGVQAQYPELADYWIEHPEALARLSDEGRRAISEAALGDPRALDDLAARP